MKKNVPNSFKSLKTNSKNGKMIPSQNTSMVNVTADKIKGKQIKKTTTNINQLKPFDYETEIPQQKPEPSSYRSNKENKITRHFKKNSEIPIEKDIGMMILKEANNISNPEEKKCQSLKKLFHSKHNSTGKFIRTNSLICQQDNNSRYHNNSSGIININNGNFGGDAKLTQQNNELQMTVNILLNYIASLNKQLDISITKTLERKDNEIIRLKTENECLVHLNKKLKMKLLEVIYTAKVYDLNETENQKNAETLMNQLYHENNYLRQANIDTVSLLTENNLTENNQSIKGNVNNDSVYIPSKHKRQRTHFNLNNMKPEDDIKKKMNLSLFSNSNNTSKSNINNEEDALSFVISDLGNMIKTLKRRSDSSKEMLNSSENPDSYSVSNSMHSNNNNINSIKQPLYYTRSSGNKEKKMIEFTK